MGDSGRLLWKYYAFRVTNSAGFYLPVAIVYLRHEGFGLDFVGLAYAVFSFAMVAAEIPTGYLGDTLGRRGSLAIGSALRAATMAAYPFVDAGAAYLALHVVWATGWAFRSGTNEAWLYELLQSRFDESEYARIEGRGNTALMATSAATAVAGAFLYGLDPALPFLANAGLALAGVPVLFTIPAVGAGAAGGEGDTAGSVAGGPAGEAHDPFGVADAVRVLRLQVRRPEVRWLVAYAALFQGLFSVTRVFEQPALRAVGVPVAGLGVLYAGFKLVSAGAAATAGWVDDRLGARGVFALLVPVYGLAYAGVALSPALVVPVLFLNRSLRVVTRPVRNRYLNDRLAAVGRATVLSGASMVLSLSAGAAKLVGGWGAARAGPVGILPAAGLAVAGAAALLWFATEPVRSGTEATAAAPAGAVEAE